MKATVAKKIFTGETFLEGHAVVEDNGVITEVIPVSALPPGIEVQEFGDSLLAPAFIDLQIYGAYGNLLAVQPTVETLQKMRDYCKAGGAEWFVPTVATNSIDVFHACIDAVKAYWQQGGQGVAGLHIEGPWINKVKRGAHIEAFIHSPTVEEVERLIAYGKGVIKIITLAPEVCDEEVFGLLQREGIVISAGHSNATYAEATAAFNSGIPVATHLYNAMSALQHREPGMVGAILNHPTVMCSIIPDGHHVDFAAVSIAKKVMKERLFIITDAVTETKEGLYPHKLAGDKYESEGTLSGSALNMAEAVKRCIQHANIPVEEALRMAGLLPYKVIGMDAEYGRIAKGYKAAFVVLDEDFTVIN